MRTAIIKADANGRIVNAGGACHGLRLMPAVPSRNAPGNTNQKAVPGSFPVRVVPRGSAEPIDVINSDAFYFAREFPAFDIVDCDAGDVWLVTTFDSRDEGQMASGAKAQIPVRIADSVALPAADPALVTDGYPLRPNLRNFTVYFSGVARVNNLWVRQLDGTWFDTGVQYDQTATTERMVNFTIGVPGDRWTLRPAGGAQQVVIEGAFETG